MEASRPSVGGRTTWYETVEQLQADLDKYLETYNCQRTHQGYRLKGRTPAAALAEALGRPVEDLLLLLSAPKEDAVSTAA